MLHSFRAGYEHVRHRLGLDPDAAYPLGPPPDGSGPDDDEHRAVLELLVATMYVDATVTEPELHEIDQYGADHGWNTPTFSFVQAMGATTALVREARLADGGIDALLAGAAARITTPEVRTTVAEACRRVASADGTTDEAESAWIGKVRAALGG